MKKIKLDKKLFFNIYKKITPHIKLGDIIYIQSDFSKFFVNQKITKKKFVFFFFDLFKKLVGSKGTIIIPSFSESWSNKKKYNKHSKSILGLFSNFFLNNRQFLRTDDPQNSVLIYGDKKKLFQKTSNNSYGKKSIFETLKDQNGKIILFGTSKFDPTFVHFIEQHYNENIKRYRVRFMKKFYSPDDKKKKSPHKCFVRSKKSSFIYNQNKILKKLDNSKYFFHKKINNSNIFIVHARELFQIGLNGLKKDNLFFVKKKYEKKPL